MTWTFEQIEPQPARGALAESIWRDPHYTAEIKYDGFRLVGQFCPNVLTRFTTRRVSDVTGLLQERTEQIPHLSYGPTLGIKAVPCYRPPVKLEGTVLDAEIIPSEEELKRVRAKGGGVSKAVGSILNSKPAEAIRKQIERGWLRLIVFDCLYFRGKDVRTLPLSDRRSLAYDALAQWRNPFASMSKASHEEGIPNRRFLDVVMRAGEEGVVLKDLRAPYGVPRAWIKVKGTWTADCVIMGYKAAKEMSEKVDGEISVTKYAKAGLIGAVVVGQYPKPPLGCRGPSPMRTLVEVATISGMTDALRAKLTKQGKKYIGKVVRIEHNGREPTGRFRHPRWDDFRTDKAAKDCVFHEGEI